MMKLRGIRMKGISPLIATVLLIGITILMAVAIGPWAMKLATDATQGATNSANQDIICRSAAYGFDSDYGNSGVSWNFNGTNGTVTVKIINTGSQNLYNFSLELTMQTPTGARLIVYPEINITSETQRTLMNPLKPGYDWIIEAEVESINDTWSLTKVKVINEVCPRISPSADV
jgi:flagellin-like protein